MKPHQTAGTHVPAQTPLPHPQIALSMRVEDGAAVLWFFVVLIAFALCLRLLSFSLNPWKNPRQQCQQRSAHALAHLQNFLVMDFAFAQSSRHVRDA